MREEYDFSKTVRLPVFKHTIFDDIRNKYGQDFLDDYNEWSKKDSGSNYYFDRLDYFSINSIHLQRYLKELENE